MRTQAIQGPMSVALRRMRTFREVVRRVLADALAGQGLRVANIVALDFAGAGAQAVMIGFIAVLASQLSSPRRDPLPLVGVTIESDIVLLGCGAGLLLALLLFSAWASFTAALSIRVLGRQYHVRCAGRILDGYASAGLVRADESPASEMELRVRIIRDTVQAGLLVETLIRAVQPLVRLLVVGASLFVLDPALALVLAPTFLLLAPASYRVIVRVQSDSHAFFSNAARELNALAARTTASLDTSTVHHRHVRNVYNPEHPPHPATRTYFDGFDAYQLADEQMQLRNAIFRAFMISVALLLFGGLALAGDRPWGNMVAFLGGLVLVSNSLQTLGAIFVSINRLYPQIRDYGTYVEDLLAAARRAESAPPLPDAIELQVPCEPVGTCQSVRVVRGDPLVLCADVRLRRGTFGGIASALAQASGLPEAAWRSGDLVAAAFHYRPGTLGENLGRGTHAPRVDALCRQFGLDAELAAAGGFEAELSDELWERLSPDLRAAIRLLPALLQSKPVLFVDYAIVAPLSREIRARWLAAFSDRHLVVVAANGNVALDDGLPAVVVGGRRLTGGGDVAWLRTHMRLAKTAAEEEPTNDADDAVVLT